MHHGITRCGWGPTRPTSDVRDDRRVEEQVANFTLDPCSSVHPCVPDENGVCPNGLLCLQKVFHSSRTTVQNTADRGGTVTSHVYSAPASAAGGTGQGSQAQGPQDGIGEMLHLLKGIDLKVDKGIKRNREEVGSGGGERQSGDNLW